MSSQYLHYQPPRQQPRPDRTLSVHLVRIALYIVIAAAIGVVFILGADHYARGVEHMRTVGVSTAATITDISKTVNGGRQTRHWLTGMYPAQSPSGHIEQVTFHIDVSQNEYDLINVGDTLMLVYDPAQTSQPIRADELDAMNVDALRVGAMVAAMVYIVTGISLAVLEWRAHRRAVIRKARLLSAFGPRRS